jgi:hypothetical protein
MRARLHCDRDATTAICRLLSVIQGMQDCCRPVSSVCTNGVVSRQCFARAAVTSAAQTLPNFGPRRKYPSRSANPSRTSKLQLEALLHLGSH